MGEVYEINRPQYKLLSAELLCFISTYLNNNLLKKNYSLHLVVLKVRNSISTSSSDALVIIVMLVSVLTYLVVIIWVALRGNSGCSRNSSNNFTEFTYSPHFCILTI